VAEPGLSEFWPKYNETTPDHIRSLSLDKLEAYRDFFAEVRIHMYGREVKYMESAERRLKQIEDAIAGRHRSKKVRRERFALLFSSLTVLLLAVSAVIQYLANSKLPNPVQPAASAAPSITPIPLPLSPAPSMSQSTVSPSQSAQTPTP
jgi:Mg2+ and Co2+ transporter CorA